MEASPGSDSYAETLVRLAKLMDEEKIHQEHIAKMPEAPAREFLNAFIQRASKLLGLTAAKVAALVKTLCRSAPMLQLYSKSNLRKNIRSTGK